MGYRRKNEFSGTVSFVWGNDRYLNVDVNGYFDPGVTNRAPEDCYPPEGDLEVTEIRIEHRSKDKKLVERVLSADLHDTLISNEDFMTRVENSLDQLDRDD